MAREELNRLASEIIEVLTRGLHALKGPIRVNEMGDSLSDIRTLKCRAMRRRIRFERRRRSLPLDSFIALIAGF